jgi:hypothetical protein
LKVIKQPTRETEAGDMVLNFFKSHGFYRSSMLEVC